MSEPTTPKEWWDIHTEWHGDWSREDLVEQVWSDATEIATRAEREKCIVAAESQLDKMATSIEASHWNMGIFAAIDAIREADDERS